MWTYNYTPPNTLQHYGILGMKWGVRRYQNKDGTLTKKGKKRYRDDADNTSLKSKIKEMSDDDLRKMLNRLQMEKQLSQLMSEDEAPKVSKGKAIAKQVLESSGKIVASKIAAKFGDYIGEKLVDRSKSKSTAKKAKAEDRTQKAEIAREGRKEKSAERQVDRLYNYYNKVPGEKKENLRKAKWLI